MTQTLEDLNEAMFGKNAPKGEIDSQEGSGTKPIPSGTYLFSVDATTPKVTDGGISIINYQLRVEDGPKGTKNRVIFPSLFLSPFREKDKNGGYDDPTEDAIKATLTTLDTMKANLKYSIAYPKNIGDEEATKAWADQILPITFLAHVTTSRDTEGRDKAKMNWRSAKLPVTVVAENGMTAIEKAKAKWAK